LRYIFITLFTAEFYCVIQSEVASVNATTAIVTSAIRLRKSTLFKTLLRDEMSMLSRLKSWIAGRFPYDETLTDERREAGLAGVLKDGIATQAMGTLTTGPFLVAFALHMGGSNFAIGLLAAIPFLTQLFQLPAVYLVEAVRRRRGICIVGESVSRLSLLVIAAAAFAPKGQTAVALLVTGLFLHASFGAFAGCSWNSWMRDFVPQHRLGAIFAKRLLLAAALSALLSFAGGAFVDTWGRLVTLDRGFAYALLSARGISRSTLRRRSSPCSC
jgi:hypothetical protein